jgi:gluconokinase
VIHTGPVLKPVIVVVTGVSGSGKTTIGTLLAQRLGCVYAEADHFHPKANIDKMRAGQPLTDADREPWLRAIAEWIDTNEEAGEDAVVSCSALKRQYRDVLREGHRHVRIVYLAGSTDLLAERVLHRVGHFFPPHLLDTQLATLEPPTPDEHVIAVDNTADPATVVDEILSRLGA